MGALGTWLVSLAGPIIRKMMMSLGIGVASYAAITAALNSAIGAAKAAWGGLGGDALNLIELTGAGQALGIITGALVARAALIAVNKLEVLR